MMQMQQWVDVTAEIKIRSGSCIHSNGAITSSSVTMSECFTAHVWVPLRGYSFIFMPLVEMPLLNK